MPDKAVLAPLLPEFFVVGVTLYLNWPRPLTGCTVFLSYKMGDLSAIQNRPYRRANVLKQIWITRSRVSNAEPPATLNAPFQCPEKIAGVVIACCIAPVAVPDMVFVGVPINYPLTRWLDARSTYEGLALSVAAPRQIQGVTVG